ncbi:hypothetical protein HZC53_02760 [Candidatus Uhrbacteria bacterium]|nr:hypothetical protein [Candidatus Uhrbacteria bacterium]
MRCPKCDKNISIWIEFCPKCGSKVPLEKRKKAKLHHFLNVGLVFFLLAVFSVTMYFQLARGLDRTVAGIIYTFVFLAFGLTILVHILLWWLRILKRNRAVGIALPVVLVLSAGIFAGAVVLELKARAFDSALRQIQGNMVEASVARIMADSIAAGAPIPGSSVMRAKAAAQMVDNRLQFLVVPDELEPYRKSVQDWVKAMVKSFDTSQESWKDVPPVPADFTLAVSRRRTESLFRDSLDDLEELRSFGDSAIGRKDRVTFMYIAAKLLTQAHWLKNLGSFKDTGFLSVLPSFATPALAASAPPAVGPSKRICIGRGGTQVENVPSGQYCIEDAVSLVHEIQATAIQLAAGNPKAPDKWNQGWHQMEDIGAIAYGTPDRPNATAPATQVFIDACHAKGGVVGGTGGVKTGLPTTESGWSCEFKIKDPDRVSDIPCWDLLTYSGGRYMGGNNGCEQLNLMPQLDAAALQRGGAQTGVNADYAFGTGTITCSGDFSQTIDLPSGVVSIRNGIVQTTAGPIPLNGNSAVYPVSSGQQVGEDGFASINELDTFTFTEDTYTATYAGTITVTQAGRTKISSCFGSAGGGRIR